MHSPEEIRAWVSRTVTAMEGFADDILIDMVCRRVASLSAGGSGGGLDRLQLEQDLRVLMDARAGDFATALCEFMSAASAAEPPARLGEEGGEEGRAGGCASTGDESASAQPESGGRVLRAEERGGSIYDGSGEDGSFEDGEEDEEGYWEEEEDEEAVEERLRGEVDQVGGVGGEEGGEEGADKDERVEVGRGGAVAQAVRYAAAGAGSSILPSCEEVADAMGSFGLEGATTPLSIKPCATTSGLSIFGSAVCAPISDFEAPAAPPPPLPLADPTVSEEDRIQLQECAAPEARPRSFLGPADGRPRPGPYSPRPAQAHPRPPPLPTARRVCSGGWRRLRGNSTASAARHCW